MREKKRENSFSTESLRERNQRNSFCLAEQMGKGERGIDRIREQGYMLNRESRRDRVTRSTYLEEKVLYSEKEIKRESKGSKIICPKKRVNVCRESVRERKKER